ncbi:hypothetical protein TUMEXPCC7403_24880 [Tumidithrix helvetica PCC 7403]|uniref:hypothetical protein n=1 Tax=Tumidithrix helvetica TaxID=3457545 RepID=UPI003CA8AE10
MAHLYKPIIDDSDIWTEEDQLDITAFSLQSFTQFDLEEEGSLLLSARLTL